MPWRECSVVSRFLLACEALSSTAESYAFTAFERLFHERGLPEANLRQRSPMLDRVSRLPEIRYGHDSLRRGTRAGASARIPFDNDWRDCKCAGPE
jgi:hypothetical protein